MPFKERSLWSSQVLPTRQKPRMTERSLQYRLHVVPHTHWDREWYCTFQQYRYRLVRLADRLIDLMERNSDFRFFVFDGQTIIIEDYLEIRPEHRERVKRLIESGRLEIGPWYVLCDEFLVSGESLVRNLLIGRREGEEYGGMMKVGYQPDAFGHIAQMPQILRGFDIDSFIFTRGLGEEQNRLGTEFLWIAPDGSRVLAINQRNGYCNGKHLGFEKDGEHLRDAPRFDLAVDRMREQIAQLGECARSGGDGLRHLLINNGSDHEEPQAMLPRIVQYLNTVLGDAAVEQTNFTRFVHTIRRAGLSLPDFSGELRGSKRHFILSGVLSARVHLKQQNHACETLLEKYAEPLSVMTWQLANVQSQAGFLQRAWRILQQNHAHDSICGCSIDQVHRDMQPRFEQARQLAEVVLGGATAAVANGVQHDTWPSFVVFNPLPAPRNEVLTTLVLVPPDHPGRNFTVFDTGGRVLPTHVRKVHKIRSSSSYPLPSAFLRMGERPIGFEEKRAELLRDLNNYALTPSKKDKLWRVIELECLLENLPACGYGTFALKSAEAPQAQKPVKVKGYALENGFLRVRVYPDGTFDVHHKATRRDYKRCNLFEDVEDAGDTYDYSPAKRSSVITSKNHRGRIRFVQKSPLAVTVECSFAIVLPEEFDRRLGKRSRRLAKCPVRTLITLNACDPFVCVVSEFHNLAKDHRLSASFGATLNGKFSIAGQAFYAVERPLKTPSAKGWKQPAAQSLPMQNFCAVEDRRGGLALLTRGLYEYRAQREGRGTALKLTLVRSVGWLSRDDLLTRAGHAGPFYPTPEAQCLGLQRFSYAVMPYTGNWRAANVPWHAQRFQAPVIDEQCLGSGGSLPGDFSFLHVEPASLQFSALKKCMHRDTVIFRIVNLSSLRTKVKVNCGKPLRHAWKVTLAENRIEEIPILQDDRFEVEVPAWRMLTIELEPGRTMQGV